MPHHAAVPQGSQVMPVLGVVIVSFNSSDVLIDCLESLMASDGVRLQVVVVDNASSDDTPALVNAWASGEAPYVPAPDMPFVPKPVPKPVDVVSNDSIPDEGHSLTLIQSDRNLGFAGGVNLGLAHLAGHPGIDRFWVLNPDGIVPPDTARAFATFEPASGAFSLMGGRVAYAEPKDQIQIDGGTINWRTGVTSNINQYADRDTAPIPKSDALDFITGASMVASRAFYETAGPLPEEYFLYYEEVDWAQRRGSLPLAVCPDAMIYHRAGTAIGSINPNRAASTFSLYFIHRARLEFVRRYAPKARLGAWAYSWGKAVQFALKRDFPASIAVLRGSWGAAPPAAVRNRISPDAQELAFGRRTSS